MSTHLYYFTGSGNSLANARGIARYLDDARVLPIVEALEREQNPEGARIGLVFPTYAYGLPRMVKEYVRNASFPPNAYIFAVASSFGIPGPVLLQLDRLLRRKGCRLQAGFSVLDERSSLIEDPDRDAVQKLMISVNRGETPQRSGGRLREIARLVAEEEPHALESSNRMTNFLGGLLHPLAAATFKKSARHFQVTDACTGCGVCRQVCPRDNIQLCSGEPVWGDDCDLCHSCIQWCPNSAIEYKNLTIDKPRYRNPEVSLGDMQLR